MSRFFHTLVVVGAAISAAACGGKSESHDGGEGAAGGAGGSGGTGLGGSAASGGGGASSGKGGGATAGSGGSGTTAATGGTGADAGRGGASGGVGGGSGGTGGIVLGGGMGGTSGTGVTGPFPEPELPTSRWDCTASYMGCVDVLGVTAHQLTGDCPVDETLPQSAADCVRDEIYTCMLAVTASGDPLLVNCQCSSRYDDNCGGCWSLRNHNGEPVSCTPSLKICECAYTGILR